MKINIHNCPYFKVISVDEEIPEKFTDIIAYSNEYDWSQGFIGTDGKFYLPESLNGVTIFKWLKPLNEL